MGNIIFAYRLTSDTGFAPCVDNNILTLSCCKGGRKLSKKLNGKIVSTGLRYRIGGYAKAHPNDEMYLMGIYKNKLLYYAKITKVITMEEYYSTKMKKKYGKRKDHIFDYNGKELTRNNNLPNIHPNNDKDEQFKKDIAGKDVVISDKNQFSYWGRNAKKITDRRILDKLPQKQEKKEYIDGDFKEMHDYIKKEFLKNKAVCDSPHDPIENVGCRRFNQK